MNTVMRGMPGFFEPNPNALLGINYPAGVERAVLLLDRSAEGDLGPAWSTSTISTAGTRA